MRSLRYWLGLPLFNAIILLIVIVIQILSSRVSEEVLIATSSIFAGVLGFGGLFLIPMITALYYPVMRKDFLPLRKTVWVSFAGIAFVCFLSLILQWQVFNDEFFNDLFIDLLLSLIISSVEICGYAIGLMIARRIANRK